jgi:hypothetical protein
MAALAHSSSNLRPCAAGQAGPTGLAFRRFRALAAGSAAKAPGRSKPSSDPSEQISDPDPQRVGDDLEGIERHALASILQPVEMNAIQAGEFGKLILRDSLL